MDRQEYWNRAWANEQEANQEASAAYQKYLTIRNDAWRMAGEKNRILKAEFEDQQKIEVIHPKEKA